MLILSHGYVLIVDKELFHFVEHVGILKCNFVKYCSNCQYQVDINVFLFCIYHNFRLQFFMVNGCAIK